VARGKDAIAEPDIVSFTTVAEVDMSVQLEAVND